MIFGNISDLEEALEDVLPGNFSVVKSKTGELIVYTRLIEEEKSGILIDMDEEDDEDDFLIDDEDSFEEFDEEFDEN